MKSKIVLASNSPRRAELLRQVGLDFEIQPSKFEEDMGLKMSDRKLAEYLALGKAQEVANRIKRGVIIGSDTFISFQGKRVGKPKDAGDARRILRMLSGKSMRIYSGIAIIDTQRKKTRVDSEVTIVKLKKLSDKEIRAYVQSGEPLDKAGAFAIQGRGAVFIEKINGCYSNVIGLPLYKLYLNLEKM